MKIIVFEKILSVLKLIFAATELQKRATFDIFDRALFCNLTSSTNLVLNLVQVSAIL